MNLLLREQLLEIFRGRTKATGRDDEPRSPRDQRLFDDLCQLLRETMPSTSVEPELAYETPVENGFATEKEMDDLRQRIADVSKRSRFANKIHWACWAALRKIAGGRFSNDEFPAHLLADAHQAIDRIAAAAAPADRFVRVQAPEARVPVDADELTGDISLPFDWVRIALVARREEQRCIAILAGNVDRHDHLDERWSGDDDAYLSARNEFLIARGCAIAVGDCFALRRAESVYQRSMWKLAKDETDVVPRTYPAANDSSLQ